MATIKTPYSTVSYPDVVGSDSREVEATVWQKEDKCRVYFRVKIPGSRSIECGFICAKTGAKAIRSQPASWGNRIESSTNII